jgi:hypothetical protein
MHFLRAMLHIAMAFTSLSPQNSAFEWNKKSTLSTERQVEFPGIVLEPGVYIIRLREGGERRSFVEILNREETQVLASVLAVPDHRMRPGGNSEFTFHDVKRDGPQPVQTWFFPGDLAGLEFVYPKARAREIARDAGSHVMSSNDNKDGAIFAVTPNGKEIMIDSEPTQAARQKPQ